MDPTKFFIKRKLKHIIESIRETPQNQSKRFFSHKLTYRYYILYLKDKKGCYIEDFDKIKYFTRKLSELNKLLKGKCPNLELKIDDYHRLHGEITSFSGRSPLYHKILLCLYYKGNCISSIELKYIRNNTMEIYTETHEDYQRKKYNTLLRSTLLIVATLLICNESDNITHIELLATNPISAWYFVNPKNKFEDYVIDNLSQKGQDKEFMSLTDVEEEGPITIIIELTDHNKGRAEVLFNELTKDEGALICPEE